MSELARGVYRYRCDGRESDITEPWRLVRHGEQLRLLGRRLDGSRVLLEVDARYRGDRCVALRLAADTPTGRRRLQYRRDDEGLSWFESGAPAATHVALPADAVLFPLLRAATGPLLRTLAVGPCELVLPDLRNPADAGAFLRPLRSLRRVTQVGADAQGSHLRFFGGEYGELGADYWIGADGVVQRYQWSSPHGVWDVRLDALRVAPGFSGFR